MNKNLDVKVKDHRRHTLHDQLLSTDNLSNEHNSPRNRHRFLPVDTEYHRADINDRLGIKFSSTKFDWYHTESWLVIQNTIINVILCKSDPDIKASMTNLRQLTTSGVEMSHIIAYCEDLQAYKKPLEISVQCWTKTSSPKLCIKLSIASDIISIIQRLLK
ncbi:unnamed protein product [Heterobilharzia americana]|nr:unnamed protein product [Heterobilharzia americana]CAH8601960.1 unnamed protein product [Heterobilharzia americana]